MTFTDAAMHARRWRRIMLQDPNSEREMRPLRIADMLNSWWAYPDVVHDPIRDQFVITGATRGGAVKVGWFNRRSSTVGESIISTERRVADDHYTRSILLNAGEVPIIVGAYHDRDAYLRVVHGRYEGQFDDFEPEMRIDTGLAATSYGQFSGMGVELAADSLAVMFRGDGKLHLYRSHDRGETWDDGPALLADLPYGLLRRTGNVLYLLPVTHPVSGSPPSVWFTKIPMSTGIPRSEDPATGSPTTNGLPELAGIWTHTDTTVPLIDTDRLELVRAAPTGQSQRTFDFSTIGHDRVLVGVFEHQASMAGGCIYTALIRDASETNVWHEEPIVRSGRAFGPSGYVGGACFDERGNVVLIRERDDRWTLERWVRTSTDTASAQDWYQDRVLYVAPADRVGMGRPRVPINCDTWDITPGVVTFGEYFTYQPDEFRDFYGDQVMLTFS